MTDSELALFLTAACDHCYGIGQNELLSRYVFGPGYFQIADWRLRLAVVDMAAHAGIARTDRAIAHALGLRVQEPHFDRDMAAKVAGVDAVRLRERVLAAHLRAVGDKRLAMVLEAA